MTTQGMVSLDDARLNSLELQAVALTRIARPDAAVSDGQRLDYREALSPSAALELIASVRNLRQGLDSAMKALEGAGYTLAAYCALDEAGRNSAIWRAVRQAWEATGQAPKYVLRYARGNHNVAAYPSHQAALEAAIESLEMCEGYPVAIELEGGTRLMDNAAILQAWGERHDPG
jgi:hypothetical protein